jgi:hypothetical protein
MTSNVDINCHLQSKTARYSSNAIVQRNQKNERENPDCWKQESDDGISKIQVTIC